MCECVVHTSATVSTQPTWVFSGTKTKAPMSPTCLLRSPNPASLGSTYSLRALFSSHANSGDKGSSSEVSETTSPLQS